MSPDNNKNCSYNLKENSTFSEESCSWLSILTIHNITHDSEGVYRCLVPNTSLAYDTLLTVSEGMIHVHVHKVRYLYMYMNQ